MRSALVLVVMAAACGDGLPWADSPDAAPDADTCGIVDCWDRLTCRQGVVTDWYETDSACEVNGGECPFVATVCPDGCDVEGAEFFGSEVVLERLALCAGSPVAIVGDACDEGSLCLPTRAVEEPDGTVTQTYLACEAGTCVEAEPPVIEGWLVACPEVTVAPSPGFAGVVGPVRFGFCLVEDEPVAPCFRSGWAPPCRGDWECPEGASCDDAVPGDPTWGGVCRPGPRGAPIDLGC